MGFNNVRREEMHKLERFINVTEITDRTASNYFSFLFIFRKTRN